MSPTGTSARNPEFLERRYSPVARSILAFMFIMSALLIHIGISLYAGAVVFQQFFGINVYVSIVIISVVTGIYTVIGGLKAVVVTETIQTLALGFGAGLVVFVFDPGLDALGGKQWITEGLGVPFMMQAWWFFCILSAFYFVVSLLTPAPAPEQVEGITWEHPLQVIFHGKLTGIGDPRVLAGMLLVAMVILYTLLG